MFTHTHKWTPRKLTTFQSIGPWRSRKWWLQENWGIWVRIHVFVRWVQARLFQLEIILSEGNERQRWSSQHGRLCNGRKVHSNVAWGHTTRFSFLKLEYLTIFYFLGDGTKTPNHCWDTEMELNGHKSLAYWECHKGYGNQLYKYLPNTKVNHDFGQLPPIFTLSSYYSCDSK